VSITITIKYQHSLKMALKTFTTADGSANQALVTNGSGVLSFAAVGASAGQVIQVVTATASNTLSVTITPSSASNKIFIIITATGYANAGGVDAIYTIFRDATDLGAASNKGIAIIYNGGNDSASPCGISILDSPNTTSAITYQLYMRNASGGGNITYINYGASKGSITCMEIKG
jgi:hypothetical protein